MYKRIVAIVGRPNVGKSTLFNRLCRSRRAIVDYEAGVTRDRKYEEVEWAGSSFIVVDTGGIVPGSDEKMDKAIRFQAEIAIEEADVIIFLVDAQTGTTDMDKDIAKILYPKKENVFLVANKCDNEKFELDIYDFLQLGFDEAFPISASHGRNTGNFLDKLLTYIPKAPKYKEINDESVKIAVVGKPNVGKSSIVNRLTKEDNLIVSDVAGTTRDSIDSKIKYKGQDVVFIDTAGLRRKKNIKYGVEYFSSMRTISSINRADVVILVLDANDDISNQDQKIASYAHRNNKDLIIAFNKWDLIEKDNKTVNEYNQRLKEFFPFLAHVPSIYISALTNQRVHKLLDMILMVEEESHKRIPTSQLNKFLEKTLRKLPPTHSTGKHVKIYYITQQNIHPPTFIFFCNNPKLITTNYKRFLHNQIREAFDFKGASIKMYFRGKDKDDFGSDRE